MATVVVRARVHAGSVAQRFASVNPTQIIASEFRPKAVSKLVSAYQEAAPEGETRRLRGGITSRGSTRLFEIVSTVRSREDGYPYTGVTRFGHRAGRIYPKHGKALAFKIGGRTIIRASVAGYHPSHDWAEDALPQAYEVLAAARRGIGGRIVAQLRGHG